MIEVHGIREQESYNNENSPLSVSVLTSFRGRRVYVEVQTVLALVVQQVGEQPPEVVDSALWHGSRIQIG